MPTILFVMKYPLHKRENLQQKFDGQMEAARLLGWDAYCIGWDPQGMYLVGSETRIVLCRNAITSMPGYDHTKIFLDLMKAMRIALSTIHVDAVYMRYMPTFSNAVNTVKRIKKSGAKFVIEYPTYPIAQENSRFWIRRQVFRYADHILRRIQPYVDFYTAIGKDCGGMLHGKPALNIVNGVRMDAIKKHNTRTENSDIRLLALASMSGWHGYDRLIQSLSDYTGTEDIHISFVGSDGDGSLAKWKHMTEELHLQNRITFHGACYGDDLETIVARCDVGVGSLGMFRYGLQQGMTLKVREFMARGLPFISAVKDQALPEDRGFFLQVSNSEAPISMAEIAAYAKNVKRDNVLADGMRQYAKEHLSWQSVLAEVLERLKP